MFSRAGNGRKPTEKIKIIPKNNPQRAAVAELRFKRIYMISKPLLMMKKEKKKKRKDGRKVGLLYWARRSALVCFGLGSDKFSSGVEEGLSVGRVWVVRWAVAECDSCLHCWGESHVNMTDLTGYG